MKRNMYSIAFKLMIGGCALMFAALLLVGFNPAKLGTQGEYTYESVEYPGDIRNVRVDDLDARITIIEGGESLDIDYMDNAQYRYYIALEDGGETLAISYETGDWRQFIMNFGFVGQRELVIYLPRGQIESLDVQTFSGDIFMNSVSVTGEARLYCASGHIDIEDVSIGGDLYAGTVSGSQWISRSRIGGDVLLESASGSVTASSLAVAGSLAAKSISDIVVLDGVSIEGDMSVSTTSGYANVYEARVRGALVVNSVSGGFIIGDSQIGGLATMRSTSGELYLERFDAEGIDAATVSGNIWANLVGEVSDYSVETETVSGFVEAAHGGGEKPVRLSTISGDIWLEYGDGAVEDEWIEVEGE